MAPLTPEETKWLKRLQKVLNECPSKRMSSYTIGDSDIIIYDHSTRREWEDSNPNQSQDLELGFFVEKSGSYLATIDFPFPVEGAAG